MAEAFIGEVRIFGFNFAPRNWALCNGQLLPIAQNQALFSLLGTTYGGNGTTTFALPDLRGRSPLGFSVSAPLGQIAGAENVTLTVGQMPAHTHALVANSAAADSTSPSGNFLGQGASPVLYRPLENPVTMAPAAVSSTGGSQSHSNMQPFITLNFCMALQGIFPSRN